MVKLKVTTIPVTDGSKIYELSFEKDDGPSRGFKLSEESFNALKDYFTPKEITDSKSIPEFDELWRLHSKGNKKTAKDRFIKVVKKVPLAELKEKLELYIKSNDFCYLKGLDVWLNPLKEHWNDPIVKKEEKFKKEEPKENKSSFFR